MNIAVFNNKGGVGKSTFTAHLGFYAQENRISATIIDADPQRCTMGWLSGHNWTGDEGYDNGSVYVTKSDKNYSTGYVIYDCPPAIDVVGKLSNHIDKWIVPIDARFSIQGAMKVAEEIRKIDNHGDIYVVVNRALDNTFGRKERKELEKIGLPIFCFEIPQADVVRKAETYGVACWSVPYGNRSMATQNLGLFCKWVYGGFNPKQLL